MASARFMACVAALAAWVSSPAAAQTFDDAPIGCGGALGYDACAASFDGWTLRVVYKREKKPASVAIYTKCVAQPDMIHCLEGRWQLQTTRGELGARYIGLRNGVPFPD